MNERYEVNYEVKKVLEFSKKPLLAVGEKQFRWLAIDETKLEMDHFEVSENVRINDAVIANDRDLIVVTSGDKISSIYHWDCSTPMTLSEGYKYLHPTC